MDPELVKASRALLAAQKENPNLPPEEADQIVKSYAPQHSAKDAALYMAKLRSDGGDAVATSLQGFLGNFADELSGGLAHVTGGDPEAAKQEVRLRDELFHADHKVLAPIVSLASGVGSAALIPGGGMVGAGRAALAGGVYGGIAGAGAGDTMEDRIKGGVGGALAGTVGGAVLGKAAGAWAGREAAAVPATAVTRNLETIEATPAMRRLSAQLDDLRKSVSHLHETFPDGPPASVLADKTSAISNTEKALASETTRASARRTATIGDQSDAQHMLELAQKSHPNDPTMRDIAVASVKKLYPELDTPTAPVVPPATGTQSTLGKDLLKGALPHFLIGHAGYGIAATVRALAKNAGALAAPDAAAVAAPSLMARTAHTTGVGASALANITKSLFDHE